MEIELEASLECVISAEHDTLQYSSTDGRRTDGQTDVGRTD